jgi:hypothetical protein
MVRLQTEILGKQSRHGVLTAASGSSIYTCPDTSAPYSEHIIDTPAVSNFHSIPSDKYNTMFPGK